MIFDVEWFGGVPAAFWFLVHGLPFGKLAFKFSRVTVFELAFFSLGEGGAFVGVFWIYLLYLSVSKEDCDLHV